MNLALYIYLCEVVGNLNTLLHIIAVVSTLALAVNLFILFVLVEFKEDRSKMLSMFKYTVPTCVLSFFLFSLTPSQKTMYAMAAAYYGEQAVKSETFQKLNGKAMQLLEMKIDELIGEEKK